MKIISTKNVVLMTIFSGMFMTATASKLPLINKHSFYLSIHDTLVIKKINQPYSKDIIIIDPNPSNGLVHVKNTSENIREVQFYVFDLDGVMIENLKLISNERKKISELSKGTYIYEVFNKDESIERGKIIVE